MVISQHTESKCGALANQFGNTQQILFRLERTCCMQQKNSTVCCPYTQSYEERGEIGEKEDRWRAKGEQTTKEASVPWPSLPPLPCPHVNTSPLDVSSTE